MDFSFERLLKTWLPLMRELKKNNIELLLLHVHCEVSRSIQDVGAKINQPLLLRQENASVCNPYSSDSYMNVCW